MRDWNVLATALEGQRDVLRAVLRGFGRFGGSGYRNILIGSVPDHAVFLDQVRAALATDRRLALALARALPIERTVRFDAADPAGTLIEAASALADRIGSGSFYVRVERRGLKGQLHSAAVERDLGERLWRLLEERGHTPRVTFRDPDHVLIVETLGEEAGLALLPRTLRQAYPFARVA